MPKPIQHVVATAIPLGLDNVDTDQIIAARFLKGTAKTGLGQSLFHDWRYDEAGQPKPDFPLNQPAYQGAKILIAGDNFGCGSSREHAPWALTDYGFEAIIASSFADIFRNNSVKNGLLTVALTPAIVTRALAYTKDNPDASWHIDLASQTVLCPWGETVTFPVDAFWKKCLLEGVDQIGYTLGHLEAIQQFEQSHWAATLPAVAASSLA